jgi:Fe-S cluster biogenesis protein NfuA
MPEERTPELVDREEDVKARVLEALAMIRPAIQMDGGDVELVKIKNGDVFVRLLGSCIGCPISALTLKAGLEMNLKRMIPEVNQVIAV